MKELEKEISDVAELSRIYTSTLERIEDKLYELVRPLFLLQEHGSQFWGSCGSCPGCCVNGNNVRKNEYSIEIGNFSFSTGGPCYNYGIKFCFINKDDEYINEDNYYKVKRMSDKDLKPSEKKQIVEELKSLPILIREVIQERKEILDLTELNDFLSKFG